MLKLKELQVGSLIRINRKDYIQDQHTIVGLVLKYERVLNPDTLYKIARITLMLSDGSEWKTWLYDEEEVEVLA